MTEREGVGMQGKYKKGIERLPAELPHCCTGKKSSDHLGVLVVAFWWNKKATIGLSRMVPVGLKPQEGVVLNALLEYTKAALYTFEP